jgi:hypothetical protein
LHREVGNFKRTITAIDDVLQQPSTQVAIRQDQDCNVGKAVNDSLLDCQTTVESLDFLLEGIKMQKRSRNSFWQSFRQIKVNWTSEEFRTIRGQMHSHCAAMQLALQTINV